MVVVEGDEREISLNQTAATEVMMDERPLGRSITKYMEEGERLEEVGG